MPGWSCYCNGSEALVLWDQQERRKQINILELLAAFFAIIYFTSNLSNCKFCYVYIILQESLASIEPEKYYSSISINFPEKVEMGMNHGKLIHKLLIFQH